MQVKNDHADHGDHADHKVGFFKLIDLMLNKCWCYHCREDA